jgi:hypothetical protein
MHQDFLTPFREFGQNHFKIMYKEIGTYKDPRGQNHLPEDPLVSTTDSK